MKTFSGGMRRRLEIARGLLHTPRVLFLDEPTLGLDPQSRNQMWTHVQNLNQTDGVTVFLTTHYMDEADRVAHRIAVIDHGRIVAIGSPAELKQRTNSESLEEAFLALTGTAIREESRRRGRSHARGGPHVEETLMRVVFALWMREVRKYFRSPAADDRHARLSRDVSRRARLRARPDLPARRSRGATSSSWRRGSCA